MFRGELGKSTVSILKPMYIANGSSPSLVMHVYDRLVIVMILQSWWWWDSYPSCSPSSSLWSSTCACQKHGPSTCCHALTWIRPRLRPWLHLHPQKLCLWATTLELLQHQSAASCLSWASSNCKSTSWIWALPGALGDCCWLDLNVFWLRLQLSPVRR